MDGLPKKTVQIRRVWAPMQSILVNKTLSILTWLPHCNGGWGSGSVHMHSNTIYKFAFKHPTKTGQTIYHFHFRLQNEQNNIFARNVLSISNDILGIRLFGHVLAERARPNAPKTETKRKSVKYNTGSGKCDATRSYFGLPFSPKWFRPRNSWAGEIPWYSNVEYWFSFTVRLPTIATANTHDMSDVDACWKSRQRNLNSNANARWHCLAVVIAE